jgi:predicted RNase H-like nuclease (RuvC/YqgF family)
MNLFLLMERVDPTPLTANKDKIKRLKSKGKAASAEVKRLDEKCKKLERDFTNLNTAVAGLRTKVNKPRGLRREAGSTLIEPSSKVRRTIEDSSRPTLGGLVTGSVPLGK